MATAGPLPRSPMPTQLRFRTKAAKWDSVDYPSSNTPSEDPLRILLPAQKKLSTIESQRILSVVDEAMRRLETTLLIPSMLTSLDRLSIPLGSELVKLLQDYRKMAAEYEEVSEMLQSLDITPKIAPSGHRSSSSTSVSSGRRSLAPIDEGMEDRFYGLRQRIQHNVKSVLRVISSNPALLQTIAKEKGTPHTKLMENIRGLRAVTNEMLLTTKLEEVKRKEHLQLVAERRLNAEDQIKKLEAELEEAEKQKDQEVSEKNAHIRKLHADIKTVVETAQESNRRANTEAETQRSQAQKTHAAAKAKLEEEISTLKRQLQEVVAENKEREQDMRKKAFKRETEVENWIHKYDVEMGEKQDELEMLEAQHTEEKKQLKELEEKLGILKVKYDEAVKEQEEARMKAQKENEEREMRNNAAIKIQSCWRSFHCRKMLLKEKQKGGKKGKGKKGKGKKKR